jgi:hypothetical protein
MREQRREIIMQTCAEMGVNIVKGVLGCDHVHMFLSLGGRIIICERGAYGPEDAAVINANTLANLVFGQFYRDPEFYHDIMAVNGFSVTRTSVKLDMMFHATTGTCP